MELDELRAEIVDRVIAETRKAIEAGNVDVTALPTLGKVHLTMHGLDEAVVKVFSAV